MLINVMCQVENTPIETVIKKINSLRMVNKKYHAKVKTSVISRTRENYIYKSAKPQCFFHIFISQ